MDFKNNEFKTLGQKKSTQARIPLQDEAKSRQGLTIGKSPEEVFAFWRNFKNLTAFMKDISDIQVLSAKRSKWTVELKSGISAEWIAEITEERPGEMIAWRTVEGQVDTSGSVWFVKAPADLGTVVYLSMQYEIPGGKLAEVFTQLNGEDPETIALTNLRRLKALLETGEIPTIEGQSSGREESPKTLH